MFWFRGHESCETSALEPAAPAVEGEVSTPENPGKSQATHFYSFIFFFEV